MQIITSSVSVYEVEIDLRDWTYRKTAEVPNFAKRLANALSSLRTHECISGRPGGFLREVKKGTDFAHVIEHVILELLHLADHGRRRYTGWTRKRRSRQTYILHYSAPDFLQARLAAVLAVDMVRKLAQGTNVHAKQYLRCLRDPETYFTGARSGMNRLKSMKEPPSVTEDIPDLLNPVQGAAPAGAALREQERVRLQRLFRQSEARLTAVTKDWRLALRKYAGTFGETIEDKLALLNPDRFVDVLRDGHFETFFRAIRRAARLISSYRVPTHFITHSIWLYESRMLDLTNELYSRNFRQMNRTVQDIEKLFALMLREVLRVVPTEPAAPAEDGELHEFREIHTHGIKLLVVDSAAVVRGACRDFLTYHGYDVRVTANAEEAEEIIAQQGETISAVLMDLFLPRGVDSRRLYRRLHARHPLLPVLFTSSRRLGKRERTFLNRHHGHLIRKPFSPEALGQDVENLLAQKTSQAKKCVCRAKARKCPDSRPRRTL